MRVRLPMLGSIVTGVALLAAGCAASLSDNDEKVCDAAYARDPRGVYAVTSLADNADLKKHASRIKVGTTETADNQAMADIREICKDGGYEGPDS